jgi:hypothetical protein
MLPLRVRSLPVLALSVACFLLGLGTVATGIAAPVARTDRTLDDPGPLRNGGSALSARADTTDVVDHVSDVTMTVYPGAQALTVPYYANRTLGNTYPEVTRAILVINGTLRNADEYYQAVVEAGQMSEGADSSAFIIAPQYLTEADLQAHDLPADYAFWAYMGWRRGDNSLSTVLHPRPARISSFALADTILYRLVTHCPNLQQIVVAGHSAGGQFSNLYAAGTGIPSWITQTYHVPVRWIVANPSCYIYFNEERWVQGTSYDFAVPSASAIVACPTYNDYKYGVLNPNEYMSIGADSLRSRYSRREVAYLLGELDTNPNDYYLDRGCEAAMQGSYRLERGTVYWDYLNHYFGTGIGGVQARAVIPGVGHDGTGMFTSVCGRYYLFGYGACEAPPSTAWEDVTPTLLGVPSCRAVSWVDYDADGIVDLYLPATGNADVLAHNDGKGVFTDATPAVLRTSSFTMCARWGDYNNDGFPDLYEVNWRVPNRLLRNMGSGVFADVTAAPLGVNGDCTDAAWIDFDNDGDLDLYVVRTSNQSCILFRNDGPAGFVNVSAAPINVTGNSRVAAWGDYNNDGRIDLFLTADGADKLFRNNGDGSFTDVTIGPLGDPGNGSSAAWADYDNDGLLDLYIVNRNGQNNLLHNKGDGSFTAVAGSPVNIVANGHSAAWGDYDNDGWLDLYLCNDGNQNRLFHNDGAGGFTDATAPPLDVTGPSFAAAWADYDGDGALDLYLAEYSASNHLYHNTLVTGRHWLQVGLVGTESNVSAVGARIRLRADGRWQTRQVGGSAGYMAENSPILAFGLGGATVVDSLVIRWPSGIVQRFSDLNVDERITVVESDVPEAAPESRRDSRDDLALRAAPNPVRAGTRLSFTLREPGPVRLCVVDLQGRIVRRFSQPHASTGSFDFFWDGRDEAGRALPSGIYLGRLLTSEASGTVRMILCR